MSKRSFIAFFFLICPLFISTLPAVAEIECGSRELKKLANVLRSAIRCDAVEFPSLKRQSCEKKISSIMERRFARSECISTDAQTALLFETNFYLDQVHAALTEANVPEEARNKDIRLLSRYVSQLLKAWGEILSSEFSSNEHLERYLRINERFQQKLRESNLNSPVAELTQLTQHFVKKVHSHFTGVSCVERTPDELLQLGTPDWVPSSEFALSLGYSNASNAFVCTDLNSKRSYITALFTKISEDEEPMVLFISEEERFHYFAKVFENSGITEIFNSAGGVRQYPDGSTETLDFGGLPARLARSAIPVASAHEDFTGCLKFWPYVACRLGEAILADSSCRGTIAACIGLFRPVWVAVAGCVARISPVCAEAMASLTLPTDSLVCRWTSGNGEACDRGSECSNDRCSFGRCVVSEALREDFPCEVDNRGYPICSIDNLSVLDRFCTDGNCVPRFTECPPGATCAGQPGSAECARCGNSTPEQGEECDHGGDSLFCDGDCTRQICGDGYLNTNASEECEGSNLNNQSCQSQRGVPGQLSCGSDCRFDFSNCEICGNGRREGEEICDRGGDDFTCDGDCTRPRCGDGYVNPARFEDCEATVPITTSCTALGFTGGAVGCGSDCRFDTSSCTQDDPCSDPNLPDTDSDGTPDLCDDDDDNDGVSDADEESNNTDPRDPDSDDDGSTDGEERDNGTDPNNPDSDNDGSPDGEESENGTDPNDSDSDDDGLSDGEERDAGTNPNNPDSDNDGIPDGEDPAPNDPGGDSGNRGDPHIVTFDRLSYDFQGLGEFVLVKSDDGELEIQSRMSRWPSAYQLSINTAVAMNVSGDRVGYYLKRATAVYINGLPTALSGELALPNGGDVVPTSSGIIVTWPDKSRLQLSKVGLGATEHINIHVRLQTPRRNTVSGLHGTFDGDSTNEFLTRAGKTLPSRPSFDELYKEFGDSWRVTQQESLFDYINGNTTDTFTNRSFPRSFISSALLPADVRASAAQACIAAGVTTPVLLESCTLDVGSLGDESLAASFTNVPEPLSESSPTLVGYTQELPAKSCNEILQRGVPRGNGNYWIALASGVHELYCDFSSDTGGWTRVGALDGTENYCAPSGQVDLRSNLNSSHGKIPDSDVQALLAQDSKMELMYYVPNGGRYMWHALENISDFDTSSRHPSSSFYCTDWQCDDGSTDASSCGTEGQGCPVTAHGHPGFTKKIYVDFFSSTHRLGFHTNGNICGFPNFGRSAVWVFVR